MLLGNRDNNKGGQNSEAQQTGKNHSHLDDIGFSSLIVFFFSILISGFIRPDGFSIIQSKDGILTLFLAFLAATCLTLLFLAMAERYILKHDNQKRFARLSALLLFCGPAFYAVEYFSVFSSPPLMFLAFSLSGCGYAFCLLVWGRILSSKETQRSTRQVLADTCAAIIIVILIALLPEGVSFLITAAFGLIAGLIGSRRAVSAQATITSSGQIVVSDTRNSIPLVSCLIGGMLWMAYGISFVVLNGVHILSGPLGAVTILATAVAALAIIAIIGLHRGLKLNLSRIYWASVPLIVVGLAVFASGEEQLLGLAVALILLSMIVSYLHLMSHFSVLAHRPEMLSDQMFTWGWLAPLVGMFIGIFVGVVCQLAGNPIINLLLPLMVGVLVVTLIISMRSIENIAARRRKREAEKQLAESDSLVNNDAQIDEVLSEIGLTLREKEVALLLLQGRSQAIIADQLFVATSTVNTHVKHIYRKADVCSKQEFIDLYQDMLSNRSNDSKLHAR